MKERSKRKLVKVRAKSLTDVTWLQRFGARQMEVALSLIVIVLTLNALFPHLRHSHRLSTYQTRLPARQFYNPLPKFIFLSYLDPTSGKYFKGNDDIYFVVFWGFVWLFLRELLMRWWFEPLARLLSIRGEFKRLRFTEQGWVFAYCCVSWSTGLRILLTYFPGPLLDIRQYWAGYPHDCLPALTKFYYLAQTAFWFQQMITINFEKHRKDHVQMLSHHVVTTLLVTTSYCTNFTGIGLAIHTTMDLSDIILSTAKMMKYAGLGLICDMTFVTFLVSWIVTRHAIYLKIFWCIYWYLPVDVPWVWIPDEGRFLTRETWMGFLTLLFILQGLLIAWLCMILKVLVKVIRGTGADDTRSDSEDTDVDVEEEVEAVGDKVLSHGNGGGLPHHEGQNDNAGDPVTTTGNGHYETRKDR